MSTSPGRRPRSGIRPARTRSSPTPARARPPMSSSLPSPARSATPDALRLLLDGGEEIVVRLGKGGDAVDFELVGYGFEIDASLGKGREFMVSGPMSGSTYLVAL